MTNDEIRDFLQKSIDENEVMLFMKGTPEQPPPLTATRSPASGCSWELRNSLTFLAAMSVRVTIGLLL